MVLLELKNPADANARYRRRVVVPLVRRSTLTGSDVLKSSRINPIFTVDVIEVVLYPLEIVSVGLEQLGDKVGLLARAGKRIADALDELPTQAWK